MKTMKNFLFFTSAFFALFSFGDSSCEAYKQQVINDCDAVLSDLSTIQQLNFSITSSAQDIVNSQSSDGNSKVQAQLILVDTIELGSWINATRNSVNSIRLTAVQLQCTSNSASCGSCDCASVLDSLLSQLQGFRSEFDTYQQSILDMITDIHEWLSWDNDLLNQFLLGGYGESPSPTYTMQDVINFYNSIGSNFTNFNYQTMLDSIDSNYNMYWFKRMGVTLAPTALRPALYRGNNAARDFVKNATLKELFYSMGYQQYLSLASLNNYAWTNTTLISSIEKYSSKIPEIQERFSIFNDFVFSADAPLSMYTDKQADGSYHDYLTNYYIKVSKGQQSGSDNYTNWFSRVELLLAALVFQDEDHSTINTNGVPSESDKNSVRDIGSSLDQQISGFVQDGNSHISVVDTSGQSIIRMISSWNTSIGQTAKPAPFVVAEFTSPDSQSRSNISLYLDTEDERLSSLIEIGHGISTLAWVSLFLLLGYNLAVYSIRALRKLISFSFSLYSAIFGGG